MGDVVKLPNARPFSKFYRSIDGTVIHSPECTRKGRAVPWNWSARHSNAEVTDVVVRMGYRFCRYCLRHWS